MTKLSNSANPEEQKLHAEMLKVFPEGKCNPELLSTVAEAALKPMPKLGTIFSETSPTETWPDKALVEKGPVRAVYKAQDNLGEIGQISHNDLHPGNMLSGGKKVTLIDFDEASKAGVIDDAWNQIENTLNIFRRSEESKKLPPKQEMLEGFLSGYLAHNPYLSRSTFQAVEDMTVIAVANSASGLLDKMLELATKDEPSDAMEIQAFSKRLSARTHRFDFVMDPEKQKEEKDILGKTYDKVFAEISKGELDKGVKIELKVDSVDSLVDDKPQKQEHLDSANFSKKQSQSVVMSMDLAKSYKKFSDQPEVQKVLSTAIQEVTSLSSDKKRTDTPDLELHNSSSTRHEKQQKVEGLSSSNRSKDDSQSSAAENAALSSNSHGKRKAADNSSSSVTGSSFVDRLKKSRTEQAGMQKDR